MNVETAMIIIWVVVLLGGLLVILVHELKKPRDKSEPLFDEFPDVYRCTSSTKPVITDRWSIVYETDTDRYKYNNGSQWVEMPNYIPSRRRSIDPH